MECFQEIAYIDSKMKGGRFDHATPHSGYGQLFRLPLCAKTSLGLHFFSEAFRSTQRIILKKKFFSVDTLMGSQEAKSDEVCLFFLIAILSLKKTLHKIKAKNTYLCHQKKEVENSQRGSADQSTSKK